jgi:acyl carrier protein
MTKLSDLVEEMFPGKAANPADPDLGPGSFPDWDSLAHYNFLLLVEDMFDVQFSPEELSELRTLGQIEACLNTKGVLV